MSRDPAFVLDLMISARLVVEFVDGYDIERFRQDIKTQEAVLRRLLVIGEATKRLSPEFREAHAHVPWKKMAGLRDVLIHDYDKINLDTVWQIAVQDIPALIVQLEPLIPPDTPPSP